MSEPRATGAEPNRFGGYDGSIRRATGEQKRLLGAFAAVIVFVVLGPPAGAAILTLQTVNPLDRVSIAGLAQVFVVFSFFAYFVGGVQALLVGIGTVGLSWRTGRTAFWHPLVATLAVHAVILLCVAGYRDFTGATAADAASPHAFLIQMSLPLSLGAGLICWFIARPLLRAR